MFSPICFIKLNEKRMVPLRLFARLRLQQEGIKSKILIQTEAYKMHSYSTILLCRTETKLRNLLTQVHTSLSIQLPEIRVT